MRLTLRALLAYMDDVLDPADQQEIGLKIEASPFATELIHRSRDAVRRLRLSAPDPLASDDGDLHGDDADMDANTVAEYLDHALPPEQVADYERVCMEAGPHSDMLLAEASSCFHILTMVLGEPAEVDEDLRERMYRMGDRAATNGAATSGAQLRIEPAHAMNRAATPPVSSAPTVEIPAAAFTPRHESPAPTPVVALEKYVIPDYLLAATRARRRSRLLAMLSACALLGAVGAWFFLPPTAPAKMPPDLAQKSQQEMDNITAPPTVGSETNETSVAPATDETAGASGDVAAASSPPTTTPATIPVKETAPQLPPLAETPAAAEVAGEMATPPPATTPAATDAKEGDHAPLAAASVPQSPLDADASPPAAAIPATETPSVTSPAATAAADAIAAPAAATAADDKTPADPLSESPALPAVDPPPADPHRPVGHYLGNDDMLLRYDAASKSWGRLPARSVLGWGERLAVLPTFRTPVVLKDSNVFIGGGTVLTLAQPSAGGGEAPADFALDVPSGRFIVNAGLNGNRFELISGALHRLVRLGPSSSLAVEVARRLPAGGDPKRDEPQQMIAWHLTSGSASWGEGIDAGTAEGPATWTTAAGENETPREYKSAPEWIDREPASPLLQRGHDAVMKAIAPAASVAVPLLELSDSNGAGRQRENRALAAECGALLGEYEPIVKALSDVDQKLWWKQQIEALRAALVRDEGAADAIRAAFATQRGKDAAPELMELLRGFDEAAVGRTKDEVKAGALLRLIRWLESDDLAYRVLASYNIDEITGTRNLGGYRPEQTASQRGRVVERYYWQRLESGELGPKK